MAQVTWSDAWRRLYFTLGFKNFQYQAKTVGVAASKMQHTTNTLKWRAWVKIFNNSAATIYWGDASVTTAAGMPILPNDYEIIHTNEDVYCIAVGAGNDARILEAGTTT